MGIFTRASAAQYIDADGNTATAPIDAPRWTYAPYGILGLLIEDATTTGGAADIVTEDDSAHFNPDAGSVFQRFEWTGEPGGLFQLGIEDDHIALTVAADGTLACVHVQAGATVAQVNGGQLVARQRCLVAVAYGVFGLSMAVNGGDPEPVNSPTAIPDNAQMQIGRAAGAWLNGPLYRTLYDPYDYEAGRLVRETATEAIIYGLNADRIIPNVETLQANTPLPTYGA